MDFMSSVQNYQIYRATAPVHVHVPQLFLSKSNKVKVSLLGFIALLEESSGGDNK